MIRQITIFLVVLITACKQNSPSVDKVSVEDSSTSIDSLQNFSITNATAEDFSKANKAYKDKTLFDTTTFNKANGEIKLPIKEGWKSFVIFRDTLLNTDDTEIREYKYLGQFDKIGFYIVSGLFWEHYECYLIDKTNGRQTTLWNNPILSPHNKFIANLSMPYGLEGTANGVQIWRVYRQDNNELEPVISKYLELDQQIWAPDDFVWETDYSLLLKITAVENYMNESRQPNQKDFYYIRLRIK
ncbi:hypothetical protein GZH53_00815 [Flavihumibacter sp. R14]|nr:hypothetical protein [Flavihumibacter soli]